MVTPPVPPDVREAPLIPGEVSAARDEHAHANSKKVTPAAWPRSGVFIALRLALVDGLEVPSSQPYLSSVGGPSARPIRPLRVPG